MEDELLFQKIECVLFVAGDPVPIAELARTFAMDTGEMRTALSEMGESYMPKERGIQLYCTEEAAQLVSNPAYAQVIDELLAPQQSKSASQSILETLAVIAYKQPVTRAEIEQVRGVRCDYSVGQLLKTGLIVSVGRKDSIGKPMLYGTTDQFLRKFGMHDLSELPQIEDQLLEGTDITV